MAERDGYDWERGRDFGDHGRRSDRERGYHERGMMSRGSDEVRSDDRIREDVNERLTADPQIDATDIEVRVVNGEVTLSGTVDERRMRSRAEECIEALPGVRDVRNDLRVDPDRSNEHRHVGEKSRGREDGGIGHSGDPQTRDDVTIVNPKDAGKR